MPTPKSIRKSTDVEVTPHDAGLTLTVKVTAYDKGLIQVGKDTIPMSGKTDTERWLQVAENLTAIVTEFYRQVEARRTAQ